MKQIKALVWSDLHLEFESKMDDAPPLHSLPSLPDPSSFDLIILAGDIALAGSVPGGVPDNKQRLITLFDKLNNLGKAILYVPGNHEYYYSPSWPDLGISLKNDLKRFDNVHLLSPGVINLMGINFIGATLWSDLGAGSLLEANRISAQSNDFKRILKKDETPITTRDMYLQHTKDRTFIKDELEQLGKQSQKAVVITHYSPSKKMYKKQKGWDKPKYLAPFYSSELNFIEKYEPQVWIHGHIHQSLNYMHGLTRIICNPRGYIDNAVNPEFERNKIITLEA